ADLLAAAADAGQMRCGIQPVLVFEPAYGFRRMRQGRATGAERAGDVLGREWRQSLRGPRQLRALGVGLGRIELEADRDHADRAVRSGKSIISLYPDGCCSGSRRMRVGAKLARSVATPVLRCPSC